MRIAAMPSAEGTNGRNTWGTVVAIATVMPARFYTTSLNLEVLIWC